MNYSPGVISTGENKDKEKEVPVKPSDKQSLFEITKRELSKGK